MRLIDADALIEQWEADIEQMEDPLAQMFTGAAIRDVRHAPTVEAPDINVGNMDTISRTQAIYVASGYCHPANVAKELAKLPSVQPEPCEDAISRQAVKDLITKLIESLGMTEYGTSTFRDGIADGYARVRSEIDALPAVQPERPTGEWIQKPRYEDDEYPDVQPDLKCPFCGYEISWWDMGNYCARCGADLKGGAN